MPSHFEHSSIAYASNRIPTVPGRIALLMYLWFLAELVPDQHGCEGADSGKKIEHPSFAYPSAVWMAWITRICRTRQRVAQRQESDGHNEGRDP